MSWRTARSQCVVLAVDAKQTADGTGWEVFVAGGRTATGLDVVTWIRESVERGAGEILITSMDRDGTSDGYDLPLTTAVSDAVGAPSWRRSCPRGRHLARTRQPRSGTSRDSRSHVIDHVL